jgi:hypothetical protein
MKNVAASVRARLLTHARSSGRDLPALIERFAMGRLLWRLAQSDMADKFVLKGAQLFSLWAPTLHRPTRDLDLLSFGEPSVEGLRQVFTELLATPAEPEDGLVWGSVDACPIRADQRYQGVRITARVTLAGAVVPVQVDIGFGDAITPAPVSVVWHELLEFPEARLLSYPPETVIAEKLDAAVQLELDNSRMKDFFDLDWLCRHMEFDHGTLRAAIVATFTRRGTTLPEEAPLALTQEFANDAGKITQWKAFLRKNRLEADALPVVITRLNDFLMPVLSRHEAGGLIWRPAEGWV